MALHILIAESDVNAALMSAQLLMNNGHQVETCTDGVHALQAVEGRAASGKAYDAVIASYRLAGFDGVRLFTELHMKNLQPAFALCIQARQLSPEIRTEALKTGCKTFFDYPVPLNELTDFVNGVSNKQHQSDTPYFGTSKLGSGTGSHETPSHSYQRQASGSIAPSYGRQSSGTFNVGHGGSQTKRVRRSITGSVEEEAEQAAQQQQQQQTPQYQQPPQAPQQASMDQFFPATGRIQNPQQQQQAPSTNIHGLNSQSTQRVRRTTTGSFTEDLSQVQQPPQQQMQEPVNQHQTAPPPPPPPPPPQQAAPQVAQPASYQVACAHCGQAFAVQRSAQEYNAACIHCGGLNRIVPL